MKSRRSSARSWKSGHAQSLRNGVRGIVLIILVIWTGFALDVFLPLERFGLIPRQGIGLFGIAMMPVLHGSLKHLISNTVPLALLLFLLSGSRANSWVIVLGITLFSGIFLWVFGRPFVHIGASGLVFGLIAFLIFSGLFEKRLIPMLVSILVGFLYGGSLIAGVMPGQTGISWDGHICGVVAGMLMARLAVGK